MEISFGTHKVTFFSSSELEVEEFTVVVLHTQITALRHVRGFWVRIDVFPGSIPPSTAHLPTLFGRRAESNIWLNHVVFEISRGIGFIRRKQRRFIIFFVGAASSSSVLSFYLRRTT